MEHFKKHHIKYLIGLVIITIFGLGMYSRPIADRFVKNVSDIFTPKSIVYQAVDEDKEELLARMARQDNIIACQNLARWQLAREKQIKLDTQSKDEAKKAIDAYGAFQEQYGEAAKTYNEQNIKVLNEQQRNAIREIKM